MVDIIMKNFLLCNYPIQLEFHDLWHMKLKYTSLKENDMLKKNVLQTDLRKKATSAKRIEEGEVIFTSE